MGREGSMGWIHAERTDVDLGTGRQGAGGREAGRDAVDEDDEACGCGEVAVVLEVLRRRGGWGKESTLLPGGGGGGSTFGPILYPPLRPRRGGAGKEHTAQPHDASQPDRNPDAKKHAKRCRRTHPSPRGIHDEINCELPLKPSRPTHFLDVPIESGNALWHCTSMARKWYAEIQQGQRRT